MDPAGLEPETLPPDHQAPCGFYEDGRKKYNIDADEKVM
jgi:hypothetical protein